MGRRNTFIAIRLLPFIALLTSSSLFAQEYCFEERFRQPVFTSEEVELVEDISYGSAINWQGDLKNLKLDIYQPIQSIDPLEKRPLLIFIHGGGYSGGNKQTESIKFFGDTLSKYGYVFASINYRLGWNNLTGCAGDTTDIERARYRATQDSKAAIRYLISVSEEFGIDTNMIILTGYSAGATIAIYSALAEQSDFDDYLYNELGSIDSSGNTLYQHSADIKALITKSGGVKDFNIFLDKEIPMMMTHGTCDRVVPYYEGPVNSCYTPLRYPTYYGSRYIADLLINSGTPFHMLTLEGGEHGDPDDSTFIHYVFNFLPDYLCDELVSTEFYNFGNGGCLIESESELEVEIAPNPVKNELSIRIISALAGEYKFEIYNIQGQLVHFSTAEFKPPVRDYTISSDRLNISRGIYFLQVSSEKYYGSYTFFKE